MNNLKWETLQQLIGKERFTISELIPALIDNQEELKLSDNDLEHIIAITFNFSTDANNCLIFTTFSGILHPRDLAEARQIIKDHKSPVVVTNNKHGFYFFDEYVDNWAWGTKDLNRVFEVGIDKAKEGGDSTSFIMQVLKPRADEKALKDFQFPVEKNKPPLFLRNPKNKKV